LKNRQTLVWTEYLQMQEAEAINLFSKFIINNYLSWLKNNDKSNKPLFSPDLLSKKVFPLLDKNKPIFFILIDNMRFDHEDYLCGTYRTLSHS